jgi:hypothetical protein
VRRLAVGLAALAALPFVYFLAHWALIEIGNEVVVLRTREPDGTWHSSRLWIVDDAGHAWLHGDAGSRWMRNLAAHPIVEVVRGGSTVQLRATPVPGPHPRIHERLREKYGIADWWVRLVGADRETTAPVRLERVEPDRASRAAR